MGSQPGGALRAFQEEGGVEAEMGGEFGDVGFGEGALGVEDFGGQAAGAEEAAQVGGGHLVFFHEMLEKFQGGELS